MKKILIVIFSIFMVGCATLPPPQGQTSKAGYVGDYDSILLKEIIVAVPTGIIENQYSNLHLSFSALINPKEVTIGSTYDVRRIVHRFSARLSSIIVKDILAYEKITVQDLPSLRDKLIEKAQIEFNKMFSKWTYSKNFDVEIVLSSIFLTDGSVGSSYRPYRW